MFARVDRFSIVSLPVQSLFTSCRICDQETEFGKGGATPSVAVLRDFNHAIALKNQFIRKLNLKPANLFFSIIMAGDASNRFYF